MPSDQRLQAQNSLENPDYDFIDSKRKVKLLNTRVEELSEYKGVLGVDTETTGLDPRQDRVRLIQIATKDFCLIVDLNVFVPVHLDKLIGHSLHW